MSQAPRVLLVEDDAMFRETVRDTLRGGGYEVLEAADGAQGVELVQQARPDLVLLDFDLPKMMGDEALERMLLRRPGLTCYVLSGKDDLHQALWMGRRGAYGWIDKYVGAERLLLVVAEGLRCRPRGFDLRRLITNAYPQPIALQYIRLSRLTPTATAAERLAAQRDLFEALVQYLGVVTIALYVERGLLEQALNAQVLATIEQPSTPRWLAAAALLTQQFAGETPRDWRHELTRILRQPLLGAEPLAACQELVRQQTGGAARAPGNSLLSFLQALAEFHALWITPERLAPATATQLAAAFDTALEEALGALAVLADTELLHVQQVELQRDGNYQPHVAALSGLTVAGRTLSLERRVHQGELYLADRRSNVLLARVSPLLTFDRCEADGLVPQGVFGLAHLAADQGAMYFSYGCGHVRLNEADETREALRHLFYSLDPANVRYSHLQKDVAVGLFDLSGYTTLTRERGPAIARDAVRRMASAVREAAYRHGGSVADAVGDEVLTAFDNPVGAVRAAVEALETIQRLNARNPEVPLHLHVGFDYGPGVVERNQVWGDVVNRAKRCQTVAAGDELVISSGMATAIGDCLPWPLEPVAGNLKGFGDVEVFQVRWKETKK